MFPILGQKNPVHNLALYFLNIPFNGIPACLSLLSVPYATYIPPTTVYESHKPMFRRLQQTMKLVLTIEMK